MILTGIIFGSITVLVLQWAALVLWEVFSTGGGGESRPAVVSPLQSPGGCELSADTSLDMQSREPVSARPARRILYAVNQILE